MVQIRMEIEGMMCGHCEAHVCEALKDAVSAKKVTADHTKNEAVILAEADPGEAVLRKAVEDLGYTVLSVESKPAEKKGFLSALLGK